MTTSTPPNSSPFRRRRAGLGVRPGLLPGRPRSLWPGAPPHNGNGNGNGNGLTRRRRAGLYRRSHRKPPSRSVLRVFLVALAVFSGIGTAFIGVAYAGYNAFKAQLPDASSVVAMEPPQDSYVYDNAGNLLAVFDADTQEGFRHVHVALANVSRWVKLATVDVEDRHFYSEGSWDVPRLVAAGVNDVTHRGGTQGASTITEQLAKNVLVGSNLFGSTSPRSLDYKIKQIVLGNEIGANFSKDQILEMYLNRIYYGNHALGIETAAELYLGKTAAQLDLAESAMLSGLPQSPSQYDPNNHDPGVDVNPLAKQRQRVVLHAMVANGDITQAQADAAYAEKLTVHMWRDFEPDTSNDPWFLNEYLPSWLNDHFGGAFTNGGWRIYTTLDPAKQNAAYASVHANVLAERTKHPSDNLNDGALVSLDPKTGEVLAMVGAWDPTDNQIGQTRMMTNLIIPGSTIKLFTYSAAVASGKFTMTTPILDAPYAFPIPGGQSYSPLDYDRHWHGTCQLKECLGNSFNMPAVKVEVATGIPYITSLENAMGVSNIYDKCPGKNVLGPYAYAATLGSLTCGISLLDLADGAATIADLGIHHDPMPVTKISVAATGQVIFNYNAKAAGRRVLPENVAFIMSEITSNNANRVREFGTNSGLVLPDRRVSAKTGTADFFIDNLTVGWTPDLLSAVWVGNPGGSCLQGKDRQAMAHLLARGHSFDDGAETAVWNPFTPAELRSVGLQPNPAIDHSCGHLAGQTSGITGAAPIWHDYMQTALKGTPKDWYSVPSDVVQDGSSDDANFFLPATRGESGTCYYWGPAAEPDNPCQYTGTGPPPFLQNLGPEASPGAEPSPGAAPSPGGVRPTPPPGPGRPVVTAPPQPIPGH